MQAMNYNSPSNTPIVKRHLDSEYRRRWETYITPTKIYDSRIVNWHDIPWSELTELRASMEGHEYIVDNSDPAFKGFIRWRWGGFLQGGKEKIDIWCIGWHDGITCYMQEIQFKDGSMVEANYPLEEFKNHLGEDYESTIN